MSITSDREAWSVIDDVKHRRGTKISPEELLNFVLNKTDYENLHLLC